MLSAASSAIATALLLIRIESDLYLSNSDVQFESEHI